MNNLLYVGSAVAVSIIGYLILALRNRRPTSVEYGVEEFAREMQALAPGSPARRAPSRGGRAG